MKRYCHSCGKPSEPASAKFCCHCGVSLSFASPPPKSEAVKAKEEQRNEEEEEEEEEEDSNLPTSFRGVLEKGLDFEFQRSPQVGEKLGKVIGTRSSASDSEEDGRQIEHQSSEEVMKEFQREAGTLRPKK